MKVWFNLLVFFKKCHKQMSWIKKQLTDLIAGQSDPYLDYSPHSGSGYGGGHSGSYSGGGGSYHSNPGYSLKTFSDNDYNLKTYSGGHGGSYSSGYGHDCCPLVIDPLTYAALLGTVYILGQ